MFLFYALLMSVNYLLNSITFDVKSEKLTLDELTLDDVLVNGFEDNFKDDPLLDDFKTHIDRVMRYAEESNSYVNFHFDFEQQSIFDTVITLTGIDNHDW